MKTRLPFILSTGCGTMPGYNGGGGGASAGRFVWYKEGASSEQTQRDLAEARMKTIQLRPFPLHPLRTVLPRLVSTIPPQFTTVSTL